MNKERIVARIIYTDRHYGWRRNVIYIKNALGEIGYSTKAIKKCGWSIHGFLQAMPRIELERLLNSIERE